MQFVVEKTWTSPAFGQAGECLEFIRGAVNFGERKAGDETPYPGPPGAVVKFSRPVLHAEVFLSGFNLWQTRGGDSEVAQIRVDAHVESIGYGDPDSPDYGKKVALDLVYSLRDEDPTGSEDYNDAWIGFTVLGVTKA